MGRTRNAGENTKKYEKGRVIVGIMRPLEWSCGELNPGPMTEPSVFYVRSLLAIWRFFCPHRCRRQLMAGISAVKVPESPCGSMIQASLLNDAQHPPKDERE